LPLTLCGEMAGRPLEALALMGLGFRSISMAPSAVGAVKAMILALDADAAARRIDELLRSNANPLRDELRAFAVEAGVPL